MATERGARCPNCSRYAGYGAAFCPYCGTALDATSTPEAGGLNIPRQVDVSIVAPRRSGAHRVLRLAFTIWLIAYPVIACVPTLAGAVSGGTAGGYTAIGGLVVGSVLLVPWLIGILVLGLLTLLTR